MTEEVRVGTLLKFITEMEASGREVGDIYKVTSVSPTRISYQFVRGATPRGGWERGNLSPSSLRQYWEVLPSVPNAQYM